MKTLNQYTFNRYAFSMAVLGFFFISLSIYKASHVAFTHDESTTFLTYVNKNALAILSMEQPVSANNHILNTLSMKGISSLMTPTPFNLRLPNIIGHFLYILFSALLINNLRNNNFKVIGFILLNANIYLIDLFSLARGYGLSLGFLMIHWYFLFKAFSNVNIKLSSRLMLIALILAIASNFSILYYALSLVIIYTVFEFKNRTENKKLYLAIWQGNKYFLGISFMLAMVFLYEPIRKLIKFKQLYFGGENNFFDDTIYSLVYYSSTSIGLDDIHMKVTYYVVLVILSLLLFIILKRIVSNSIYTKSSFFIGSFFIIMLIQITSFYLFNTKYLIQRTAVFLIPIFIFSLLAIINEQESNLLYFLASILAFVLFFFTLRFTPLENSINWTYDADNKKLLSDLKMIHEKSNYKNKLSIGIDWIFHPSLNYYRATTDAGNWLDTVTKEGYENKKYNYYFVEAQSAKKFIDTTQFKVIKTYFRSHNLLIKNLKFE